MIETKAAFARRIGINKSNVTRAAQTGRIVLTRQVKLTYATNTFTALGLYDIQITYTDAAGYTRRYPNEGTGLRMRLNGSNT